MIAGISTSKLVGSVNCAIGNFEGRSSLKFDTSSISRLYDDLVQGIGSIAFRPNLYTDAHSC